jgi:hypothetical protein
MVKRSHSTNKGKNKAPTGNRVKGETGNVKKYFEWFPI